MQKFDWSRVAILQQAEEVFISVSVYFRLACNSFAHPRQNGVYLCIFNQIIYRKWLDQVVSSNNKRTSALDLLRFTHIGATTIYAHISCWVRHKRRQVIKVSPVRTIPFTIPFIPQNNRKLAKFQSSAAIIASSFCPYRIVYPALTRQASSKFHSVMVIARPLAFGECQQ